MAPRPCYRHQTTIRFFHEATGGLNHAISLLLTPYLVIHHNTTYLTSLTVVTGG